MREGLRCKRCGYELTPDSRFCENCGAPVESGTPGEEPGQVFTPRREHARVSQETVRARQGEPPQSREERARQSQPLQSREERAHQGRTPQNPERRVRRGEVPPNQERRVRQGEASQDSDRGVQQGEIRQNPDRYGHQGEIPQNLNRRGRQGEMPQNPDRRVRQDEMSPEAGDRRDYQGNVPQNPDRRPRQGDAPRRDYDRAAEYEKIRQEQQQRARYRQENVGSDWEQSWEREQREAEDEGHTFTPVQYVLLGLIAVLIIALLTFGIFWLIGRTKDHSSENRVAMQTSGLQTDAGQNKQNNVISILDGGGETQTAATQKQEPQTAAPAQTVQTEPQQDITLDYKEFTVTLPASWKGKYGITQSGSNYVFYQQASRTQNYNGTLFTIGKYTDTSYRNLPNYQELGAGGGAAYIFVLPTDVQFPPENEAVKNEYVQMSGDLEQIRANIRILVTGEGPKETEAIHIMTEQPAQTEAAGQQMAGNDYILAESSTRALTDGDVTDMSYDDLQMAINEIYARHGRKFATESIQSYFEGKSWYQGTVDADHFDDSVFSAVESQNIQFLLKKMEAQE